MLMAPSRSPGLASAADRSAGRRAEDGRLVSERSQPTVDEMRLEPRPESDAGRRPECRRPSCRWSAGVRRGPSQRSDEATDVRMVPVAGTTYSTKYCSS